MAVIVNDDDIRVEAMVLGEYETNAYTVVCQKTGESLVIDAPDGAGTIIESLRGTRPRYILLTHDHDDHTGVLVSLRSRLKVPLAAHAEDSRRLETPPEILLKDGDILKLGKLRVEALHTPGHTPGSLCFRVGKHVFVGDTIFPGGPGKTWSPDDYRRIIASITGKIFALPGDTGLYPGHGPGTTVQQAREEYAAFAARPHAPDLYGDVVWLTS